MQVVDQVGDVRSAVAEARRRGATIGLVPTMGALHAGHVSLVEAARSRCGFVVATIFVNPTQFGPGEDFTRYPRTFEDDLQACRAAGADLVFHPQTAALYPAGFSTFVDVEGLSASFEGAIRPGHFRGVATIVLKLFNIVQPDVAYFGQKDFQQQALIRRMVRDLDVPVDVVVCPTVREPDGLALSSRNRYLDPQQRQAALALWRALEHARQELPRCGGDLAALCAAMRDRMASVPGVEPDYAAIVDPETLVPLSAPQPEMVALVAARLGTTRLIDNLRLHL